MANFGAIRSEVYDRVSRSQYYRDNLAGLSAHQRHQRLLAALPGAAGASAQQQQVDAAAVLGSTISDEDVLRAHHRFLRGAEDDAGEDGAGWGARLARRYYARLFKEFAIADLSRYKESKIGMRWRTKDEVVSGKGQFSCGAKGCSSTAGLASYEVNFAYVEAGQQKQALVKLRLCEDCAHKLNYRKEKQYRKLGMSRLEQQEVLQQAQQLQREKEEQRMHKRKQKHKDRDRGADCGEDKEHYRQHDNDHKRQRRSKEDEGRVDGMEKRQQLREQGGHDSEGLTEADIEKFLDDMFGT